MTEDPDEHIYIFARKENGRPTRFSKTRLYSLSILKGENLIRNFIPCYRKEDDVRGLFDTVTREFYFNAATGIFEKGIDIDREDISEATGNLIIDKNNENYSKYQIPIRLTNRNDESEDYSIYLNSPLKENEYIDFRDQKVVRSDGTLESITLPELSTYDEYTKIEVLTDTAPSKIEVTYTGYTLD